MHSADLNFTLQHLLLLPVRKGLELCGLELCGLELCGLELLGLELCGLELYFAAPSLATCAQKT